MEGGSGARDQEPVAGMARPEEQPMAAPRPADTDQARGEGQADQARSAVFRALLLTEVVAAGFFGLVPLAAPDAFATLFGYAGTEPFLYRIAGAATTGYAVMALIAFLRSRWATVRITLVATFVFNVGAVVACLLSADAGDVSGLVGFVLVAAALFAVASGYWLYRDQGARIPEGTPIEDGFRATLIGATAVAAVFGVLPLLVTHSFVSIFSIADSDLFIYRLAGASTLGYAVAGLFQLISARWAEIRLQVVGAITFNALGAISAAIYLANGGRSLLGILVLLAAGFFTLALTWWSARAAT